MKSIQFKRQRLLVIFVLALAVSVALGTFLPVSTQTPTAPSPCEQLKVDIQTRAKEDAKADRFYFFNTDKKKKKIGDILNLYKLRKKLDSIINKLSQATIKSIGGWDFILKVLSLCNLELLGAIT